MISACNVIESISNPRCLSQMASCDVASFIHQSLRGGGARHADVDRTRLQLFEERASGARGDCRAQVVDGKGLHSSTSQLNLTRGLLRIRTRRPDRRSRG
jgi:hypothetical protein